MEAVGTGDVVAAARLFRGSRATRAPPGDGHDGAPGLTERGWGRREGLGREGGG